MASNGARAIQVPLAAPKSGSELSGSDSDESVGFGIRSGLKWQHKVALGVASGAAVVLCATTPLGSQLKDLVNGSKEKLVQATGSVLAGGADEGSLEPLTYVEPVQHYAQDCWKDCGGAGPCVKFCGAGNSCCKYGHTDDPDDCKSARFFPALTYHTCVRTATGPELKQLPLQPRPAPPRETMDVSRPPQHSALGYNGIAWKDLVYPGEKPMHILAIGDWGGMDGLVITDVRPTKEYRRIIQYKGGDLAEPHTMARSRPGCKFPNLVECFNTKGKVGPDPETDCLEVCGWTPEVDEKSQLLVAEQFKKRAAEVDPQFVLNVGDNFYWGGIETDCGTPMGEISPVTKQQFDHIYEQIYNGPGLDGKPWLSVLGNHDWGGRYFNAGWDQQIAYTWASDRWVMPAAYYSVHVSYPDQGFDADIFMIDTNMFDAADLGEDPEHNICGAAHNPHRASCEAAGGPPSLSECKAWFEKFWQEQTHWLEAKLGESKATWQIVVTHFPCGTASGWFNHLHNHLGLDFLVTGHRHEQELWANSPRLGGLSCIVTGGGGGITSENPPRGFSYSKTQYGFFDLAISKDKIDIELINWEGESVDKATIHPKA